MGNPASRKEKATPSDIRRRSNQEQWDKPLREPIRWSLDDYGRGQQP